MLAEWPRMPAPVIADRIGWPYSLSPLKKRLTQIRPEYVGVDPVDRTVYEPGEITQCDLWFPEPRIPVAAGQDRMLPVLVICRRAVRQPSLKSPYTPEIGVCRTMIT